MRSHEFVTTLTFKIDEICLQNEMGDVPMTRDTPIAQEHPTGRCTFRVEYTDLKMEEQYRDKFLG